MSAYHHVSELEAHGISHQDSQKLVDAGFCTVESVVNATMRKVSAHKMRTSHKWFNQHVKHAHGQLQEVKGISEQKAQKLREAARKIIPQGFVTAATVFVPMVVCPAHLS